MYTSSAIAKSVKPQPSTLARTPNAREAKNAPMRNAARWTMRKKAGGNAFRKLPMGMRSKSPSERRVAGAHPPADHTHDDDEHGDEDRHVSGVPIRSEFVKGEIGE